MQPKTLIIEHHALALAGHQLRDVRLAGNLYGEPPGDAPVYVLLGGITAAPDPLGGDDHEGWWPALRSAGLIDVERHTVLCPALPGHGTSWRGLLTSTPADLPSLSVLDLADLVAAWLEGIGCDRPVRYVGASLGGLVGLALAARHPTRVERLVSISAGLRPDGWGTATRHLQRELVRDALRLGDGHTGMVRARQLGMLTYRSRHEIDTRFGVLTGEADVPPVAGYLDHHGKRFADDFHPNTFLLLSEAIDRCHLADTAAGVRTALEAVTAEVAVVGVPDDLLFPFSLQNELHRELQAVGARSSLWKLESLYGHDAFLADQDRLADVLRHTGMFRDTAEEPVQRFTDVGSVPQRVIRVGLIGCGTVGQGLLELLHLQKNSLDERYNVRFDVVKICVRDILQDRGPHAVAIPRCSDVNEVVSDPDVDVVVEVAGGVESMLPAVTAALAAGKPVVTANKALLAHHLGELAILAHRTNTPLACEAAAAAALPIIRALSHRADEVSSLLAIVNGTNNYILTRLEQDEWSMDKAIAKAQSLGLAEVDPSADVDGWDAAAKLSILAYRSFGEWLHPSSFPVRGIRELTPVDADLAEAMGYRIRHLARARRSGDELHLAVEPALLPDWHLLANVEEEYNAVYLECANSGDLSFFGKGAGGLPTAAAVLGDLIDLAQDNSARWPAPGKPSVASAKPRRHFVRVSGDSHPGLPRRVEGKLKNYGLEVLNRATRADGDTRHLAMLVSPGSEVEVVAATADIAGLARVQSALWLGVL
jgi:homoserine O-acetyltransferase